MDTHMYRHSGRVVPFVTLWEAERDAFNGDPLACLRPYMIDGTEYKIIYHPEARGKGRPVAGKLHGERAAYCASKGACQICGDRPEHGRFVERYFSVPIQNAGEDAVLEEGKTMFGTTLPICAPCVPIVKEAATPLVKSERVWVRAKYEKIVGAIISANPEEEETLFAPMPVLTPDWSIRELVIQITVTKVLGPYSEALAEVGPF